MTSCVEAKREYLQSPHSKNVTYKQTLGDLHLDNCGAASGDKNEIQIAEHAGPVVSPERAG